jgi:hypothetical protein
MAADYTVATRSTAGDAMAGRVQGLGLILLGGLAMATAQTGATPDPVGPRKSAFAGALISSGPAGELGAAASTYDWLIGVWDAELIDFLDDGSRREQRGEWHFSWTLEGRAVQDVLIAPRRFKRNRSGPRTADRYGTSIRIYDAKEGLWRITWINPATGAHDELTGRRIGADVVQEGKRPNGQPIRWVFTQITPVSCLWYGEALQPDGRTWKREAEFHLRKRTAE